MLLSFVLVAGIRIHAYLNPKLNTQNGQENYAAHFNDVQRIQIAAAQKFGMHPLIDMPLRLIFHMFSLCL